MSGKAILLVVIGFSLTLLAVGQRFGEYIQQGC